MDRVLLRRPGMLCFAPEQAEESTRKGEPRGRLSF